MEIRKIQDADVENKKVILRVGFDVSIENGHAKELFKLKAVKGTLDYLISKNAKIALFSYLGRPGGKIDPKFSMGQLVEDVQNVLGVKIIFIDDCIGEKVSQGLENLKDGEVLMLENPRFYPGEDANDEDLAKEMAKPFDVFINDVFSQSHRDQASVTGITKFLPSYAGLELQKEIEEMEKIKNSFERPAVAIIGGAKIETKLPVIKLFEEKYDYVLVGGKIANEAIEQGMVFSSKVILPVDFAGDHLDIGEKTIEKFKEVISGAKTIVWNGPMGKFEQPPYDRGTREVLDAVVASNAFTLIGGGESVQVLEENNLMEKISFVSTGGGAMLEYLSGNAMPGIEAIKK